MSEIKKSSESTEATETWQDSSQTEFQVNEVQGADQGVPNSSDPGEGHIDLTEAWTPVAGASNLAEILCLKPDSSVLDKPMVPVLPPNTPQTEKLSSAKGD